MRFCGTTYLRKPSKHVTSFKNRFVTLTASRCFRPFSVFALCSHIFNSILLSHRLSGFYLGYRQPRSQDPGFSPTRPTETPRQNVYACARLSISGLFFSHTFQSDQWGGDRGVTTSRFPYPVLPRPVPFCSFVSRLPPFTVFFPSSCKLKRSEARV